MLIIGHRGAPTIKNENTLASFQAALDEGVDGIELDVQLSKDNQLVVFHDLHTYQLNGKHELICHHTLSELRLLKPTIPTLSEALTIIPSNIELHIEIKSENIQNKFIINKVYQLINQHKLHTQVILSSFNPFVLASIKKHCANIRIGLLWTKCPEEPWLVRIMSNKILTYYSYYKLTPYSFHANIQHMTLATAEWAKQHNMRLYYYTINNQTDLERAKQLYADAIFSDDPNILTK
tara:strand:- start:1460 stop:2167 length:708 start_codon:yes stop_codon:yes gene_type:complete